MPVQMTCENCGQPFYCYQSEAEKGRKYCSLTCRSAHRFKKDLLPDSRTPIPFTCKECGKPFVMMKSYLTAYRKKFDHDPIYCSQACSNEGRRKDTDARSKAICKNCGKEFHKSRRKGSNTIYREQVLCSKQCKNEWVSKVYRAKHGSPQVSRRIRRGYVILRIPASNGEPFREVLEHRQVMEGMIGRPLLPHETPHHINGQRADNRPQNLELWSSAQPHGQRIPDKVAFAIEMLTLYPEFARDAGYELHKIAGP